MDEMGSDEIANSRVAVFFRAHAPETGFRIEHVNIVVGGMVGELQPAADRLVAAGYLVQRPRTPRPSCPA